MLERLLVVTVMKMMTVMTMIPVSRQHRCSSQAWLCNACQCILWIYCVFELDSLKQQKHVLRNTFLKSGGISSAEMLCFSS
jgi:hypothetical protein